MNLLTITVILSLAVLISASIPCVPKFYGENEQVCKCNSTVCDTLIVPKVLRTGTFLAYTSSRSGKRFEKSVHQAEADDGAAVGPTTVLVSMDPTIKYQSIVGFGGALTDAAMLNYDQVSAKTKFNFLKSYYSPRYGIAYNTARLPMASTDFSTRVYSYNDGHEGDFEMKKFGLQPEDYRKIKMFKRMAQIIQKSGKDPGAALKIFACPWSAPAWLKDGNTMIGGKLKRDPRNYQAWANYFSKFAQAYEAKGVPIWGFSLQNEAQAGFNPTSPFQSMLYTPEEALDFATNHLCPTLKRDAALGKISQAKFAITILDDNRMYVREWTRKILGSLNGSTDCVSGIGVHWYLNVLYPADLQTWIHEDYPAYFILPTEACLGSMPWDPAKVMLGNWHRAERYAVDILGNLLNWAVGWTDWNLGLSLAGGPNWRGNYVDSAVLFNASADEFYKQPTFYAIGHFSKFLPRGSVRIYNEIFPFDYTFTNIMVALFEAPDNYVAIILNPTDHNVSYIMNATGNGLLKTESEMHSFKTIIWPKSK